MIFGLKFKSILCLNDNHMKTIALISAIILTISVSCKKVQDLLRFNMNHSVEFVIPGNGIIGNVLSIVSPDITTNSEETFSSEGTRGDLVKEIKLRKASITAIDPPNQNFRFIKSIKVFISFTDGSNERLIAYKDNVPEDIGSYLEMDIDENLLLDAYIKQDKFKLRTEYVQRGVAPNNTTVRCDMTFRVTADPL
jgi:hypothetical protein